MTRSPHRRGTLRRCLVTAHWLIGISAGTLLMVIGLTGALLAFEDELLDIMNPGVRRVVLQPQTVLTPDKLLAALPVLPAGQSLRTLVFSAEAGRSVEVHRRAGQINLPPIYADPYTAAWLGGADGFELFAWIERLHRYLLLPRESGRLLSGILTTALMLLMLTGLYLRWPSHPLRLRSWFTYKRQLKGRAYWWSLHSVVATWAFPAWLLLSATGIYWSFDLVRNTIDAWAGVQRVARATRPSAETTGSRPDLAPAWRAFTAAAPAWHSLRLRLPDAELASTEWLWVAPGAAHARQRNRLSIRLDGRVENDLRFAEQPLAKRALATIHPLHMGTYFGLPGRLIMALAALALPLTGLSGWILYWQRRRRQAKPPIAGRLSAQQTA